MISPVQRAQQVASGHKALCTLPVLLIVLIAALDNADKSLLASSFPMLERTLGLDVATLGYFSLFTNLSYSLSLPFWGWLVHRYSIDRSPTILSGACLAWGLATIAIALFGSSVAAQALFRSINGAAIASILPLSQTMLVEFVRRDFLGRAFGLMGFVEKLAGTVASASIIWFEDWQKPHFVVGVLSVAAAIAARSCLKMKQKPDDEKESSVEEKKMRMGQIVRRIAQIPAFLCLVAQGVFGGIPWDMMSFILLLLEWKGFTKDQIVMYQVSNGISGTVGTPLGGYLGDYFAFLPRGRMYVAATSVFLGIISFGMFIYADSFFWTLFWSNTFHVVGSWTPAAANRPICAELAQNPSERAQIVAMWILLEKTSAAVFGAPLVGYLTSGMIDKDDKTGTPEKVQALSFNIFFLSALFWSVCIFFWLFMAYLMDSTKRDYSKVEQEEDKKDVELAGAE